MESKYAVTVVIETGGHTEDAAMSRVRSSLAMHGIMGTVVEASRLDEPVEFPYERMGDRLWYKDGGFFFSDETGEMTGAYGTLFGASVAMQLYGVTQLDNKPNVAYTLPTPAYLAILANLKWAETIPDTSKVVKENMIQSCVLDIKSLVNIPLLRHSSGTVKRVGYKDGTVGDIICVTIPYGDRTKDLLFIPESADVG